MGEAARRRNAETAIAASLRRLDLGIFAKALRHVVASSTDSPGEDCYLYARIGASCLNDLGVRARAVAGHASWRVGPGASDVISHNPNAASSPSGVMGPSVQGYVSALAKNSTALFFHAWIELLTDAGEPAFMLDPTLYALPQKARQLDEADGGVTDVQWEVDYLIAPCAKAYGATLDQVVNSYSPGVFAYARVPGIESLLLSDPELEAGSEYLAGVCASAYAALKSGSRIALVGIDRETGAAQRSDETPAYRPLVPVSELHQPAERDDRPSCRSGQ